MRIDLSRRPSDDAAIDSAGYWNGVASGRFLVQRCTGCGSLRHYPRPMCAACHGMAHDWVEVAGGGTLRSWTLCHHAFDPAFQEALPYVLALAELDEGVRVNLPLVGLSFDRLRLGLRVRVRIGSDRDGTRFPLLEPFELPGCGTDAGA